MLILCLLYTNDIKFNHFALLLKNISNQMIRILIIIKSIIHIRTITIKYTGIFIF